MKDIIICKDNEEAIRDSDIISFTTTVLNDVSTFPEIKEEWVKKGALISMPSAARFDSKEFVAKRCKMVVDNYSLYEAWEEEYPYPTYDTVCIVGSLFTDLVHEGLAKREDIIDISDIITGKHVGRESDDEIIIFSVGGMPVEDIAWGHEVYKNALANGIGVTLPLWDKPDMA